MKCDICNSNETYVKVYQHEYIIKGETIKFDAERRFCSKCNNLVYDEVLDDYVSKYAIELYNKNHGITKEQIIQLRKKYNLSQSMFAKIIGCAKKTLISYEKGTSIPNDIYLVTLKTLIDNPDILLNMVNSNVDRFDEKEYKDIKIKLSYGNNINLIKENISFKPSIFNGFTNLSIEKIKNMILFFSKDIVHKTKLLKEMFYADFIAYKTLGYSITGLEYIKAPHGPVPDNFEFILNSLLAEKAIDYDIKYFNEYQCHDIIANVNVDKTVFSNDEINILKQVLNNFKNYTSKAIEDYSHKEKGYIKTNISDKISYDYAFDIKDLNGD